jgi:hypothetical protein
VAHEEERIRGMKILFERQEDGLNPSRGIVNAIVVCGPLWVVILGLLWSLTH